MLECLDAVAVRRWCAMCLDRLRDHQQEIDELNVYPVPDGDTGTNLVLTVESAHAALAAVADPEEEPARLVSAVQCMARGALLGARGNSGVIVSQLLRGTAEALAGVAAARGRAFADALEAAAKAAYAAVAHPVEGTVLTVARAAAHGATAADSDDLATVVRAAASHAATALAQTPRQLPALARAGVVDAGGAGLLVLLDALVEVVTGHPAPARPARVAVASPAALTVAREAGSDGYAYEVQYLLDATDEAVAGLSATLDQLGDSLVIVGAGASPGLPMWNVHVHVNDVGAAIEAGVVAGRPHRISVTRFADQMAYPSTKDSLDQPAGPISEESARSVVVVAAGSGLADLFAAEGATVVDAPAGRSPSTAEVLAAITGTGASCVVVLPNDANVHAVADLAATEARALGVAVGVVPTRSPVQALAAIAVRDPARRFHDDVIAMAEAAGNCRYAEVTVASRAAITVAGRCEAGDVLGLVDGEVNLIGRDLRDTCRTLLDRLLSGGGELVTLVVGASAPDGLGEELLAHLTRQWPFVEAHCYAGGQDHYPLLVGVE